MHTYGGVHVCVSSGIVKYLQGQQNGSKQFLSIFTMLTKRKEAADKEVLG